MADNKTYKTLYLVKAYYVNHEDRYADGKVRICVNGRRYLLDEEKESWVPEEVIDVIRNTEHDVWINEETESGFRRKKVRRRRVNCEILDSRRVAKDYEVDVLEDKVILDDGDVKSVSTKEGGEVVELEIDGEKVEI